MIVDWGWRVARAKSKMKGETLIVLMDRFALAVLKHAEVAEDLPDKIAAGMLVTQWVWIKHHLKNSRRLVISELRS